MMGYFPLRSWEEENFRNEPQICRRCGGSGRVRLVLHRRKRRPCPACHGTGGAIDDERAWWREGR